MGSLVGQAWEESGLAGLAGSTSTRRGRGQSKPDVGAAKKNTDYFDEEKPYLQRSNEVIWGDWRWG